MPVSIIYKFNTRVILVVNLSIAIASTTFSMSVQLALLVVLVHFGVSDCINIPEEWKIYIQDLIQRHG